VKMNPFYYLAAALALAGASLFADQITLSNGDTVTGEIIDTADGKITVKTEFMGEVKIDRKGIKAIDAGEPLHLTLESGEQVVGAITTEGEELTIKKKDATEMALNLEALKAVRNDDAQAKWEREQQRLHSPGWLDFWRGSTDLGLAMARGNSRTTTISSRAEVIRETGFDKITLTYSQLYSTQSTTEPFGKTANKVYGGAKYGRDISRDLFLFGTAAFTSDEFQNLDLRTVLGGGLGWHMVKNDITTLDFGSGANWNREAFDTPLTRNSIELNLSETSSHSLRQRLKLYQSLIVFPNLSENRAYRVTFEGGLDVAISNMFALKLGMRDDYLSNPVLGNRKNDLIFTTGVKFTFDQR